MIAHNKQESSRVTWKDVLIISFLIFYAWFAYDAEDSRHALATAPSTVNQSM